MAEQKLPKLEAWKPNQQVASKTPINRLNRANKLQAGCKRLDGLNAPPDRHEKAAIPASLATNGIAAEPIGWTASGQILITTLHPFQSIGQLAAGIVARLALGGVE